MVQNLKIGIGRQFLTSKSTILAQ